MEFGRFGLSELLVLSPSLSYIVSVFYKLQIETLWIRIWFLISAKFL